jgi:hypothetical protein
MPAGIKHVWMYRATTLLPLQRRMDDRLQGQSLPGCLQSRWPKSACSPGWPYRKDQSLRPQYSHPGSLPVPSGGDLQIVMCRNIQSQSY